jgi:hypothetical protein
VSPPFPEGDPFFTPEGQASLSPEGFPGVIDPSSVRIPSLAKERAQRSGRQSNTAWVHAGVALIAEGMIPVR